MKSSDANQQNEQTNCKKIIDSDIPIEELLGSVTAYNNVEGSEAKSQQLRTSARVFKKMKLDSAASLAPVVPIEKKEPVKEEVKPEARRFRPLWTQEDKDLFFEALNEYGKDFEAIHSFISNKLRKKGLPETCIKSKDQIRHFYYRSWHKISKHLKFSEEIKKLAQELYSLINYGELRKKIGFVTEKTTIKLNELIYRGSVNVRHKGKTIRIRTPMCKALRKLNQLDEKHDDLKLPTRVTVELRPKDIQTFTKVQDIAQNPRVKTIVPLQKRLSSIIKYMNERWKTKSAEEYDKAINSVNLITSDCITVDKVKQDLASFTQVLRFSPPSETPISLPSFNLSEYLTSQSICLNAYEERIGVKIPGEQLFPILSSYSKNNSKKGTKRPRHESSSEKVSPSSVKNSNVITINLNSSTCNNNNNNSVSVDNSENVVDVDEVVDVAVNEILALQQQQQVSKGSEPEVVSVEKSEESALKTEIEEVEVKIDRVKKGWTVEDCGNVSIGDLYLMFGSDSKLILEYGWEPPDKSLKIEDLTGESLQIINSDQQDNNSQQLNSRETAEEEAEITASLTSAKAPSLTLILQRLLSIAKLHYRKNIVKCPCGHICGGNSGNIVSKSNKTTVMRVVKEEPATTSHSSSSSLTVVETSTPVPILLQTQVNSISPTAFFRRPNSPNSVLHAQLASIRRLKPKYCNRRGRFRRSQQVVVERKLPVLANKADRDTGNRQIVQMNIISQNNTLRQIAPKIVDVSTDVNCTGEVNQTLVNTEYVNGTISVISLDQIPASSSTQTFSIVQHQQQVPVISISDDNATTPSRVGSPTSISNLLEMALAPNNQNNDIILSNINSCSRERKDDGNISFAGLLPEGASTSTPPTSPSRILKENEDNQWLNSEVGDFSLSSFLGHLESPMKSSHASGLVAEDSRMCLTQDVEQHLQSLLTENSLDYSAKFADLAAQVIDTTKK